MFDEIDFYYNSENNNANNLALCTIIKNINRSA